jgi:hypothetical protein
MAAPLAPERALTLEDLPDDLLRLCVRGGSKTPPLPLHDIISFGMCSRRLRALVQAGGVVRELHVWVRDRSSMWRESAAPFWAAAASNAWVPT